MALPSGLPRVPNFTVLKMLGKGSFGKVYKVQRTADGVEYALKETDLSLMDQSARETAVNEIRLLVSINHPNVIRYHDSFLQGHKLNVVMEYAPFGDLEYYIKKGFTRGTPFPEEAIWRIFLQLCRGLEALHAHKVIHRDIKPANIFLCQNDLLKIGDLGIAKALTVMNLARTVCGTPYYMAPEVWIGRAYTYSSDLWSLGAVLYEMLTFRKPMSGHSLPEVKANICRGHFTPVPVGRYSPELISFCHLLLSTDPKKRPSPGAVLASPAAAKWLHVLPPMDRAPSARSSESGSSSGARSPPPLLDTIVVPRDLKHLPKKLPPANYNARPPSATPSPRPASAARTPPAAPLPSAVQAQQQQLPPVIPRIASPVLLPGARAQVVQPHMRQERNIAPHMPAAKLFPQARAASPAPAVRAGAVPGPRPVAGAAGVRALASQQLQRQQLLRQQQQLALQQQALRVPTPPPLQQLQRCSIQLRQQQLALQQHAPCVPPPQQQLLSALPTPAAQAPAHQQLNALQKQLQFLGLQANAQQQLQQQLRLRGQAGNVAGAILPPIKPAAAASPYLVQAAAAGRPGGMYRGYNVPVSARA